MPNAVLAVGLLMASLLVVLLFARQHNSESLMDAQKGSETAGTTLRGKLLFQARLLDSVLLALLLSPDGWRLVTLLPQLRSLDGDVRAPAVCWVVLLLPSAKPFSRLPVTERTSGW